MSHPLECQDQFEEELAHIEAYKPRSGSPASDCSASMGEWTIDLLEDGSLKVQATGRGSHRVLTFGDASNAVTVTTEKIVKRNDEMRDR